MPLSMAQKGDTFSIIKVSGRDEMRKFLENLGFVAGSVVTVLNRAGWNLIVSVKGARVAISREAASHITV